MELQVSPIFLADVCSDWEGTGGVCLVVLPPSPEVTFQELKTPHFRPAPWLLVSLMTGSLYSALSFLRVLILQHTKPMEWNSNNRNCNNLVLTDFCKMFVDNFLECPETFYKESLSVFQRERKMRSLSILFLHSSIACAWKPTRFLTGSKMSARMYWMYSRSED